MSIFVVRIMADGSLGKSDPCRDCMEKMKQYGIRRVYYSVDDNTIGLIKITENTKITYMSAGFKKLRELELEAKGG